jgi:hypothetical protein
MWRNAAMRKKAMHVQVFLVGDNVAEISGTLISEIPNAYGVMLVTKEDTFLSRHFIPWQRLSMIRYYPEEE